MAADLFLRASADKPGNRVRQQICPTKCLGSMSRIQLPEGSRNMRIELRSIGTALVMVLGCSNNSGLKQIHGDGGAETGWPGPMDSATAFGDEVGKSNPTHDVDAKAQASDGRAPTPADSIRLSETGPAGGDGPRPELNPDAPRTSVVQDSGAGAVDARGQVVTDARDGSVVADAPDKINTPDSKLDAFRSSGADSSRNPIVDARRDNLDVGGALGGVGIYLIRDYEPVDNTCASGNGAWLDIISQYIQAARQCVSDSDCTYVSFSSECGEICPFAMSKFRVGEFDSRISPSASTGCASCPSLEALPLCALQSADVLCRSGQCEFKD
jgi:hypothetical protein